MGLLLAEMWMLVPTWSCCWPRCGCWCQHGAAAGRDVDAGADMELLLAKMWMLVPTWGFCWPR
jgi:hypothetical protein